jgi:hypothetical protein
MDMRFFGLVGCEGILGILFFRWYVCLAAARKATFSSRELRRLLQQTSLLCLAAALLCLCLFLPEPESELSLGPLAISPLFFVAVIGAICQFLLIFVPRWPRFRCMFFLPGDEDEVRFFGACEGILAAASAYPKEVFRNEDELDTFVRSGGVMLKRERFPLSRLRRYRLTNDFARYCDTLVEGYRQGYRQFFAECQTGDLCQADLERLRGKDAQHILSAYALRYLHSI